MGNSSIEVYPDGWNYGFIVQCSIRIPQLNLSHRECISEPLYWNKENCAFKKKVGQKQYDFIFIKRILQVEVVYAGIHLVSMKAKIFAYRSHLPSHHWHIFWTKTMFELFSDLMPSNLNSCTNKILFTQYYIKNIKKKEGAAIAVQKIASHSIRYKIRLVQITIRSVSW